MSKRARQRSQHQHDENERQRSKKSRTEPRAVTKGRRKRSVVIGAGLAAVVVLILVTVLILNVPQQPLIVTYCGGEGTAQHYHVLLVINANGRQQGLPYITGQFADIGYINDPAYTNPSYYCSGGGVHALHTHDGSGIIHAELPSSITTTPTLGNFFTIWGQALSNSQVWTFSGHVTATMKDMSAHTTTDYSSDPGSILLFTPPGGPTSNPFPIPQNLIFNGQYGNGASGGVFDGEIIWLNVTAGA